MSGTGRAWLLLALLASSAGLLIHHTAVRADPLDATGLAGADSAPAGESVDWGDCLACHTSLDTELPRLSLFRPSSFAVPIATCEDCHTPLELAGPHNDWTHPVRSVAAHLACTDCHAVAPHDADSPPPLPYGDYDADGCFTCHREVSGALSSIWSHGSSARVSCRDCHPAHEPLRAALPPALLPSTRRDSWQGFSDWYQGNSACLDCHPPGGLILPLDSGFVTLNTRNYHDVHVESGGVLCVECHDPHGSRHRGMIRDFLLDGRYLQFTEQIDGASCTVVCHGVDHQDWRYINEVF
jgi:predicted CXXCH cytochrome family protein